MAGAVRERKLCTGAKGKKAIEKRLVIPTISIPASKEGSAHLRQSIPATEPCGLLPSELDWEPPYSVYKAYYRLPKLSLPLVTHY